MGIYDRRYLFEEPRRVGGDRMMVTNLVIINAVIYFANYFSQGQVNDLLSLKVSIFREPWNLWQLVTYGFAHAEKNMLHIIGNMFCLWFFGREIEYVYGKKTFLMFYLSTIILAGVAWILECFVTNENGARDLILYGGNQFVPPCVGASGGVSGVILLYIMHFPQRTLLLFGVIPMPAWLLGVGFVLWDFLGTFRHTNVAHTAHLAGFALGLLFYYKRWHLFSLIPDRWSLDWLKRLGRPKFRIHRPDEDQPPQSLGDEVDRILEKISNEGEDSLTPEERKTLESASRRYRNRKS